ncbi:amidase [Alloalcanivorax gelatiniphagus]|uniref:Amidase n=1 Tax=Alloalcanivorax gelatiniphagus TaxID=1194167 RepID=A0ABY2XJG2_9GAMM|nr:amidase [Alloalcanivorax gelatiniphagus]TMW11242.1 amidase [Alloalcanivorax gelatiniphagus]
MNFEEYRRHDGLGLAELVAKGEVTAGELLEVAIQRAEAVNPKLNGLVIPLYDEARRRAGEFLEGPFAGVPMLVKDLFQEIGGAPAYSGNKALKAMDNRAPRDSELVRRWKAAGLVPFGRTNTPEFGSKGVTEPESFGATRNPWNTDHTPGGSSGGSAALTAAGVVPFAGANDGGGSIRIPAACCGLFGLKPGRGRTPWGPEMVEALHGISVNHVVSRSVRDSAALLDATHGDEHGSLFHIAPPERSYLSELERDPRPLKIGFSLTSPIGTPVDPEAVKAVQDTARLLESLGHHVEEAAPSLDMMAMSMDWLGIWFTKCAGEVARVKELTGCGDEGFEMDTLAMAAFGHATRADEYLGFYQRGQLYSQQLADFHDRYDLWLTPTLAMQPAAIGASATPAWQQNALKVILKLRAGKLVMKSGLVEQMARENMKYVPFTQLANFTGVPAMSVPLHWCDSGLPMGVHFVGTHGDEGKLLALAGQLEKAKPWFDRMPEV